MFLKIAIKYFLLNSALDSLFDGISQSFNNQNILTIDDIKAGDVFSKIYRGDCYHYNCRILNIYRGNKIIEIYIESVTSGRIRRGTFAVTKQNQYALLFYI